MRLLRNFQERFGFTRNELTALTVLSTVFLAGSAVKLWIPAGNPISAQRVFSYAALDSQFVALSGAPRDTSTAVQRPSTRKSAPTPASRSIDLNGASPEELQRLPGIGPAIARRIVAYREEHGSFRTIDDVAEVKGIGPRTLERIRPFIVARLPGRTPKP